MSATTEGLRTALQITARLQREYRAVLRRGGYEIAILGTGRRSQLTLLYAANASGKSNLIKAMSMAQTLVLRPVEMERAIPVVPFKLDAACRGRMGSLTRRESTTNDR